MMTINMHWCISFYKHKISLTCLLTIFLFPVFVLADESHETKGDSNELDLAAVQIESEAARQLLGMESIKVRKRETKYMPRGVVPVIKVKVPSDEEVQNEFKQLVLLEAGKEISNNEINAMGNIYSATRGSSSYWISRSSGSYKYTNAANSMGEKSKVKNFKHAVQAALSYVGEHRLITLAEGETADILFVSAVKNVLATVNEKKSDDKAIKTADVNPIQEFTSDYYVGFGRRLKTVPVWGSRLVIRVDGKGGVASVFKNWRSISGYGAESVIDSSKPLAEKIVLDPAFHQRHDQKDISFKDLYVIDRRCGYIEAPVNYIQEELRPGCIATFRIGEKREELYPQILVSLENGIPSDRLYGTRALEGADGK